MSLSATLSPAARDRLIASAWSKARLRVNDLARGFTPRGPMAQMMSATDEEICLSGPAGTGKSRAILEKINRLAWDYPRMRALIVRKTRASMTESTLVTFEDHVLGQDSPIVGQVARKNRHSYTYPNGSIIVLGGMDKATRIMSTEYDVVYVPEATELTVVDYESLLTRLRNGRIPYQQMLSDCNPDRPDHWLKQRADRGDCLMLYTKHEDNPRLWDGAAWTDYGQRYLARLDRLTGVRKARLRHGQWVGAEGAVYEQWDPAVHLVDRFEVPAEWRRIRVIDFGYVNPLVCLWIAIDGDGRAFVYRQLYETGLRVEVAARRIMELSAGEAIEATVADHDAEDRATLAAAGIDTIAAQKEVKTGIELVQARLEQRRLFVVRDGLVRTDPELMEAAKPVRLEDEIGGYVWASNGKEQPVKQDDHGMDALRYGVAYLDREQMAREIEFSLWD